MLPRTKKVANCDTRKLYDVAKSQEQSATHGAPLVPTLLSPLNGGTMEAFLSFSAVGAVTITFGWLMYNGPIQDSDHTTLYRYKVRFVALTLIVVFGVAIVATCYKLALVRQAHGGSGVFSAWWAGAEKGKLSREKDSVRVELVEFGDGKATLIGNNCEENGKCAIGSQSSQNEGTEIQMISGRPPFQDHFSQHADGTLAVFLCGPAMMCSAAQKAAIQERPTCDIHQEIFDW